MSWHKGHGKSESKTQAKALSQSQNSSDAQGRCVTNTLRISTGVILSLTSTKKNRLKAGNWIDVRCGLTFCSAGVDSGTQPDQLVSLLRSQVLDAHQHPFCLTHKESKTSKRLPQTLHPPMGKMWMHARPYNNLLRLQTSLINKTH